MENFRAAVSQKQNFLGFEIHQLTDVRIEPRMAGWETPRLLLSFAILQLIKFFNELSTTGPGYSESALKNTRPTLRSRPISSSLDLFLL